MGDVIVGIDLGTTNSLVALCDERGPRVLTGGACALLPSVVRVLPGRGTGEAVVGEAARASAAEHAGWTFWSFKRLMGRSIDDVRGDLAFLPYEVVEGEHRTARVRAGPAHDPRSVVLSPQELSASVLRELRARAERELDVPVGKAVITVPAYFDDAQRQATRDAGRLAGLEVVRIINEPTAAALAYGLGLRAADDGAGAGGVRTVAVYDLGGGTFDVSVLRIMPAPQGSSDSNLDMFQVLATAGDTRLGGDDIDHAIVGELRASGASLSMTALLDAARTLKHALGERESAEALVDGVRLGLARSRLEDLARPIVERTIDRCRRALADAERSARGHVVIDRVILVGGATRMPMVAQRVGEFFGLEPYRAIDPDRAVALGAAVMGSMLGSSGGGGERRALLLDVIPLSLGIETAGGAMAKLVMRNSTVPARATEMFSTQVDGQRSIKLNVLQGEREMASDCRSLGVFELRGIPPMPAGIPQLEVEFLVDSSGILRVSAHERRSGKRTSVQIVPNHGLSREEVDRMERDALQHAREDMARHHVTDLIAGAGLDVKWIGERLEKLGDRLEPAVREDLERRLADVRSMIERARSDWRSVEAGSMQRAKEALDRASIPLQELGIAESLRQGSGPRA